MAAEALLLLGLLSSGDEVLAATDLYGGTSGLLRDMARFGISARGADAREPAAFTFTAKTRLVFVEAISNPTLRICPIEEVAAAAHEAGALLAVDNTVTTPYLYRPIEHGADLVIHSATKFLGGHHDATAGVIAGRRELMDPIRAAGVRFGPMLAPFEAWLTVRGMKTLAVRLERACSNAAELAEFFAHHPKVEMVSYPGLPSHPQHGLAARMFPAGPGAMIAISVARPDQLVDNLRLVSCVASFGGVATTVSHPATTSHRQLSASQREAAGISDGLLRISVGIEAIADLVADFRQALS